MRINELHSFDIDLAEARSIQLDLAKNVVVDGGPSPEDVKIVAGCDVAFDKKTNRAFGSLVILSFPELETIDIFNAVAQIRLPYIPGYLSFRELEVLLKLFRQVKSPPGLVLVDGQGIAHHRGIGLASHLGLFLEIPTIGCAKSRLVGKYDEVGSKKGERVPLLYHKTIIGSVLRTRDNVKPMFISPGNGIDVERATEFALACTSKYRLPEPTRRADIAVAQYKKDMIGG